jgi:hypothetical protein
VNAIQQVEALLLKPITNTITDLNKDQRNQHHLSLMQEKPSHHWPHAPVLRVKLQELIAKEANNLRDARVMLHQQ